MEYHYESCTGTPDTARTGIQHNQTALSATTLSTGFAELDAILPDAGWARSGLVEILLEPGSLGAMRLLMPVLAQLSVEQRWLSWVSPPSLPSVSALATAGVRLSCIQLVRPKHYQAGLDIVTQSLENGKCSAVLAWPMIDDEAIFEQLRHSACIGNALGFMFRDCSKVSRISSAGLRLQLQTWPHGNLVVSVLDQRGHVVGEQVSLGGRPVLPRGVVSGNRMLRRVCNRQIQAARPLRTSSLYCR